MIDTSAFKKGVCLVFRDEPVVITDISVSTPTTTGIKSNRRRIR